ncbi:MAG: GatB/YqeY domain-containing protein [Weeksellaceae bacterium]|nr:GatB/YqeY domain-containing protein [Weeksellaceae bacterium]
MSLETQINEEIKNAMRAKDKVALDALRAVKSALLLAKTAGADVQINEADEIAVLQKQIKMRKEAADQFSAQGREEMAENERLQSQVIEQFLPKQLSAEELTAEIQEIISGTQATSIKDMGKVMAQANQKLAGKVDGKLLADEVKKQLNS